MRSEVTMGARHDINRPKIVKRGARGRFVKGHCGGPGRPRRQTEVEYLTTMRETISLQDWAEMVRAMVARAKKGDVQAFQCLCKFNLPAVMPEQPVVYDDPEPEGLA